MQQYLPLAQIIISVLLIICILLQQRGTAMGSAFGGAGGGGSEGGFYATKRGIQKKVYYGAIIFGALFIIVAILNLLF